MKKETSISLDMRMTGQRLKHMIRKNGYAINDIQRELKLSCPQPIYRWINGQTMPSIDNLYRLSNILKMHMEDLLIPRQDEVWILMQQVPNPDAFRRLEKYQKASSEIYHKKIHESKKAG